MTHQLDKHEDEIDLRELFRTISKYKIFIFFFTLLITIGAIIFAYSKTPIYEVKANIQLGHIGKEPLANRQSVVKTLSVIFDVDNKTLKEGEEYISKVASVAENKKVEDFIEVVTLGISNVVAQKKAEEVLVYLQKMHEGKLEELIYMNKLKISNAEGEIQRIQKLEIPNTLHDIDVYKNQKIKKIDEKIAFLRSVKIPSLQTKIEYHIRQLEEYDSAIKALKKSTKLSENESTTIIASIQMLNYQNLILNSQNKLEELKVSLEQIEKEQIVALQRQKENIQNKTLRNLQYKAEVELPLQVKRLQEKIAALHYEISPLKLSNHVLVGDFIQKDTPAKPKKKLIVVVAFVTSLILAIFLVFFIEFFRKEKLLEESSK